MTSEISHAAPVMPSRPKPFSQFFADLRVHWRNWWNRKTARAYNTLAQAMRDDPSFALSWHCNIAMPILDGSKGKLTHQEANEIAERLMSHLFDVKPKSP
jgi:hypothetical protein